MIQRISEFLRKRKIDAEIDRITKDLDKVLLRSDLTPQEKTLLKIKTDELIYRLELTKN